MKWIRLTLLGGVLACVLHHMTVADEPAVKLSPADQKLIENASRRWRGMVEDQYELDQQNIKQSIQEMAEADALYEKVRLLLESQVHRGESELQKESATNLDIIRIYEKSRPTNLGEWGVYREALLLQGMVCVDLAESEEALKWARQARKIHHLVQRQSASSPVSKLRDDMATRLRLALICLGSKQPQEALRFLNEVNAASEALRQHPLVGDVYLLRSKIANSEHAFSRARDAARQALAAFLKQFPHGHPQIAEAQCQLATAYVGLDEFRNAQKLLEDADTVLDKRASPGKHESKRLHADINRLLAQLYLEDGQEHPASVRANKSLELYQQLFAKFETSHPDLILALNSLAELLSRFRHPEAIKYAETAWTHCQRRVTKGPHYLRIATQDQYGQCLRDARRLTEARQQLDSALAEALQLYPKSLYPHGHDRLALSQWHAGGLLGRQGQYEQSLVLLQAVEASYRARYPTGHPQLAIVAADVGVINLKAGNAQASYRAFASALSEDQRQLQQLTMTSAETRASKNSKLRRIALSGFLSATRGDPAQDEHAFRWTSASKGVMTRWARARQAHSRQSQEFPGVLETQEQLNDLGTRMRQLLSHPEGEAALLKVMGERDRLQSRLRKPLQARDIFSSDGAEFREMLRSDAVFIQIVLYSDLTGVGNRLTDAEVVAQNYVAFVLTPGQKVQRIELGSANLIDQAVNEWRNAEREWDQGNQTPTTIKTANTQAEIIRKTVWLPISKWVPPETTTLLLDVDGNLAQFPFAAIPKTESQGILLEDYAIAYVPDGQFMQEGRQPGAAKSLKMLTVGFVDYGYTAKPKYTPLAGTQSEVNAVIQSAGAPNTIALTGQNATVVDVQSHLSKVDAAFIATHADFQSEKLAQDKAAAQKAIEKWRGEASPVIPSLGLSEQSPYSYVGLVLAGANDPSPGNVDRGILHGEGILNLNLDRLRLVVLSCCKTALGEQRPLEAVQGMQQAFHYAGCRNVVATLWSVNDDASAALIQEFIRQLESGRLSSLEALRRAQLKIYRNSRLLPERFRQSATSPVHAWGAFIHSGLGTQLPLLKQSPPDRRYAWFGACGLGLGLLMYAGWLLRPRSESGNYVKAA